jgi:lysophospholipase L1-like esterase
MATLGLAPVLVAGTVRLKSVADTTLFESAPNDNMGGWSHFVAGTTGSMGDRTRNRALIRFDLAGSVPPGATVTAASLKLIATRIPGTSGGGSAVNSTFALHRALQSWGEGDQLGDRGAPAGPGEATWNWRRAPAECWNLPGGEPGSDFATEASASVAVAGLGAYVLPSTPALVADVQFWLDQPAANHGWFWVSQSEERAKTARAFGSSEDPGREPELEIEFTPAAWRIDRVDRVGQRVTLEFLARAGYGHAVQWTPQLPAVEWGTLTNLPPEPTDRAVVVTDAMGIGPRFYRVQRLPSVLAGGYLAPVAGEPNSGTADATLFLNVGNAARVWRDLPYVDRVAFYFGPVTHLVQVRVNVQRLVSGHMVVVAESANLRDALTPDRVNTIPLTPPLRDVRRGDFIGLGLEATGEYVSRLLWLPAPNLTVRYLAGARPVDDTFRPGLGINRLDHTLPIQLFGPPADVLLIGDSLASGEVASASLIESKPDTWTGRDLGAGLVDLGYNVQNVGLSDETSTQVRARWSADVLAQQPRVVVIHVGGNDLGSVPTPEAAVAARAVFLDHLDAMLDQALASGITPVVLGILPRTRWCHPPDYWRNRSRREWNAAARDRVKARPAGRAYFLPTDPIVGEPYAAGDAGNLDWIRPEFDCGDQVHLNEAGHAALARALRDFFLAEPPLAALRPLGPP